MSEEDLDAQIEKLHGLGAVEALNAAIADGSVFSESSRDLPDEERGLYAKYRVVKFKPRSEGMELGGFYYDPENRGHLLGWVPMEEVTDPVFVMKFDDPPAQDALWVYANSIKAKYPKLAADIKEQITQAVERAQAKIEYGVWHPEDGSINPRGNNYEQASGMAKAIGGKIVYKDPSTDEWIFEKPMVIVMPPEGDDVDD